MFLTLRNIYTNASKYKEINYCVRKYFGICYVPNRTQPYWPAQRVGSYHWQLWTVAFSLCIDLWPMYIHVRLYYTRDKDFSGDSSQHVQRSTHLSCIGVFNFCKIILLLSLLYSLFYFSNVLIIYREQENVWEASVP